MYLIVGFLIADLASTLDSELADRSRVCKEKISLNYFAQKCNRRHNRFHCSPDGEITDSDFICRFVVLKHHVLIFTSKYIFSSTEPKAHLVSL